MKPHVPQNQLYIENHILMRATYPTPERHRHTALHLMIADPTFCTLSCEVNGTRLMAGAIMIATDVEHTAMVDGMPIVMLFDVTSDLARSMERQYLQGKTYHVLAEDDAKKLQEIYQKYVTDFSIDNESMSNEMLQALDAEILETLHLRKNSNNPIDSRISAVIKDLQKSEGMEHASYARACKIACLSPGRFSHLFKEQVGISFRSYLVMIKLRTAYEGYLQGLNATEISMRAGFDSPSHFAGTIHRMFGLSFTDFSRAM